MKTIVSALALFYCYFAFGQSFKYRNYNYKWEESIPTKINVDPIFAGVDAVILDEKVNYNAGGNIVPNRYYSTQVYNQFVVRQTSAGLSPVVSKYTRIKYMTQKGIDKHSTFILPESFDPHSDYYSVKFDNRDSILRPKGEFECIRYFEARIISPDGKIRKAQIDESTQLEIERYNQIDRKFYNWIFRISDLIPGDELELAYAYEGAYNQGTSNRIFFNGGLPKQNYRLIFHYPSRDVYIMNYYNGAEPNDSTMVTPGHPSYTEYVFNRKNLYAGINEPGSRPFKELPYVSFYQHYLDYGEVNDKTKFVKKAIPYPWWFVLFPLASYQGKNVEKRYSRTDRTTVAINDFLAQEKKKIKDTSAAIIMSSAHHTIANEFKYDSDIDYYANDEGELENLGKYVERKTLRRISRNRLYEELFSRLDRNYYTVLFTDKRIERMAVGKFDFLNSSRMGFAAEYKNSVVYFYPKSYRYGYETNELPFYYEDIDVILIPQHEPYLKQFEEFPRVDFQVVRTPFSTENENTRTASSLVNISLDSMSVNFDLRLNITGQFSTLLRPYYLNLDKDTTINPVYFNLLTDAANDDGRVVKNKIVSTNKKFPYETIINSSYRVDSKLKKEDKNYYHFELNGCFNNIMDEKFTSHNRKLDYYPDFKSTDIHRYMLKFDHQVKLENINELQTEIKNSFGEYSVKINQHDEKSIFIETVFIIKAEVVKAAAAKDVEEIFNAIKKISSSSLYVIKQ